MLDFLTTSDAARLLGVSADMVRCYERTGRLAALRTAGGVRLFTRQEVNRLVQARATQHPDKGPAPARLVGSAAD
jgi:excisionase family DNA binding protein